MEDILNLLSPKDTLSSKILSTPNSEIKTTNLRSDGRNLYQSRPLSFSPNPLHNRKYSISVSKNNSSIITALSCEISKIKASEKPGITGGYFVPNVEMYSNANPLQKPGRAPLQSTQFLNMSISNILNQNLDIFEKFCFGIKDAENFYCFVCYLDVIVLSDDGSLLDLIFYSLARLFSDASNPVKIPVMRYEKLIGQLYQTEDYKTININLLKLPISLTFSIFNCELTRGQKMQNSVRVNLPKNEVLENGREDHSSTAGNQQEIRKTSFIFIDPTLKEQVLSENNTFTVVGTLLGNLINIEQLGSGMVKSLQLEAIEIAREYFMEIGKELGL